MAIFYPSMNEIHKLKVPPTNGEWMLLKFLSSYLINDEFEVYFQSHINGSHPDIIIMRKNYGIFIIEVKDYNLNSYEYYDEDFWALKNAPKQTLIPSPVRQVKVYKNQFHKLYLRGFLEKLYLNEKFFGLIRIGVFLSEATSQEIKKFLPSNYNKNILIFGGDSLNTNSFNKILDNAHLCSKSYLFSEQIYNDFHRVLLPSMQIIDQINVKKVTLNKKQRDLAVSRTRKTKIIGVAGTGKTRVLAQLAVNAYLRTRSEVLILTFNITLRNYIRDAISVVRNDIPWENFIILHYHQFINTYKNENTNNYEELMDTKNFILKTVPYKYKTILVDEVQDYQKDWIDTIHNLLSSDGELVFFGDEKQNIYSRDLINEDNGKRPYTKIKGNWNRLKETYRMENSIAKLANRFQYVFFNEKYGVNLISAPVISLFNQKSIVRYYYMATFSSELIVNIYYKFANEYKLNDNDICFLCPITPFLRKIEAILLQKGYDTSTTFETESEFQKLKNIYNKEELQDRLNDIRRNKKFNFEMGAGKIKLSTIHSFKGWELTTIILIIVGDNYYDNLADDLSSVIPSDELLYTAITRARNNLIVINIENEKYHKFFKNNIVDSKIL